MRLVWPSRCSVPNLFDELGSPRRVRHRTAEGYPLVRTAQLKHSPEAAELLAQRFADAVDHTLDKIVRRPTSGVVWPHRQGYQFALVKKPFDRWLIFYRQPDPMTIELVDITR